MFGMRKEPVLIFSIVLLSSLLISGCLNEDGNSASRVEVFVDVNGGGDFDNIQDAIATVADGGTVYVNEGVYSESITINKSISLIGDAEGRTILNLENASSGTGSFIHVVADNCTIKGFTIPGNKDFTDTSVVGIDVSSSNNNVFDNFISGVNDGIYLRRSSVNNRISGNNILNCTNGVNTLYSHGNSISDNNISSCQTYGIYILSSDDNNVSHNFIYSNMYYGVRIKGATGNIVFNNSIIENKQGLLCCCGATGNVIYNNVFKENEFWNGQDDVRNKWDNGAVGNYWDDYTDKYQNATQNNGIWDTPYIVTGDNEDNYPLVNPPDF
jgi:parallel beta-helix repeat protein